MKTKYFLFIVILLSLLSRITHAQSSSHNYIHTRTYTNQGATSYLDQIQYFDGLGRPIETVQVGASPKKADLITYQEYDYYGRESNLWLPVVKANNKGAFINLNDFKTASDATYSSLGETKAYSHPIYEPSPLNRVLEQYGPGQDWHTKGKSVKTFYLTNKGGVQNTPSSLEIKDNSILSGVHTACQSISLKPGFHFKSDAEKSLHLYTDPNLCKAPTAMPMAATVASATMPTLRDEFLKCTNYQIDGTVLKKQGDYKAGELYVTLMIDEDDNKTLEFKDKLEQVVLTRQINGSEKYDTYYVYDDFGNLRYVLPPLAVDRLTNYAENNDIMKQFAYIYKYDHRNRCIWKKLPGAEPIFYVYDKADRLIFTQDGEQRTKGEWAFSIPDVFGRVLLTGVCSTANKAAISIGKFDNWIIRAQYTGTDAYLGHNLQIGQTTFNSFTLEGQKLHSVNFYDNYSFLGKHGITDGGYTTPEAGYGVKYDNAKGLLTGTLTAQMLSGGSLSTTYLYSVMYYDNRGRIIQTKSNNHLEGFEKEYIAYNFVGQPIKKKHDHKVMTLKNGSTTKTETIQTEIYDYVYDHAGRLTETKHNGVIIASNSYDELGRLKENKKGGKFNTTYAYNIRSWTTNINTKNGTTLLFNQNLSYNTGATVPQWGGNISAMTWQVGATGEVARTYQFKYDQLSRLTDAIYSGGSNKYTTAYTYDKHGNFGTIKRYGNSSTNLIDNLTLAYNGNQLINVKEEGINNSGSTAVDFRYYTNEKENGKLEYNANGALRKDSQKGVQTTYNSLNLPMTTTVNNNMNKGNIQYTYSAGGQKLKVVHTIDSETQNMPVMSAGTFATVASQKIESDYVGNKIYEKGILKQIMIDGGYYDAVKKKYYYYLTDHLGNNRVVVDANGTIDQYTHYYPFGMTFSESKGEHEQRFKYNGKELDRTMQLNTYDYAARYMDPAIGRFTSIDPLAEKYYSWSPYAYAGNNPINAIDINGDSITILNMGSGLDQHLALLIQNEAGKWQYFSVNGTNVYISGTHQGGRKFNDLGIGEFDSPQQFLESAYNSKKNAQGEDGKDDSSVNKYSYSEGYTIGTSKEQDDKIRSTFTGIAKNEDYRLNPADPNQCANVVQRSLESVGIDVKSTETIVGRTVTSRSTGGDSYTYPTRTLRGYSYLPSTVFGDIRRNNSGTYIKRIK